MKRKLCAILVGLAVSAGMTWAGTADNNPADFPTTIDWCQYVCAGSVLSLVTPTAFTSSGADTGLVGLSGTGQNFEIYQQGVNWNGNFSTGMGIVYNGSEDGNTPADVVLDFNQAEYGAGAYVETDEFGAFTATITLYDFNDIAIGSYVEAGTSAFSPGTAIFIGAYDPTADVWAVGFNVLNAGGVDDAAIGMAGLMDSLPNVGTPEPATMLLIAPALLGLAAFGRKRIMNARKGR
ncbi:MAG: PEP-CTERM sorting domain-containing protein [Bryobacteraceae bacterium]|jgi:hypothetical protein